MSAIPPTTASRNIEVPTNGWGSRRRLHEIYKTPVKETEDAAMAGKAAVGWTGGTVPVDVHTPQHLTDSACGHRAPRAFSTALEKTVLKLRREHKEPTPS